LLPGAGALPGRKDDVGRALPLPSGIARGQTSARARSIALSGLLIGSNAAGIDRNLGKS
jgi:hypothetical protein